MKIKADEARAFVQKNHYNDSLCFMIDMSLPSNQDRFFVYSLKKDTMQNEGLVAHGHCNQAWLAARKYSNVIGCGCTALGKYKVATSYMGQFGLAFKLYGLDKTNDNAFARAIVLHAHDCVPGSEVSSEICE
ncbi:MAG TPA: murein L,D-transpeptidase catalytic domain family protein, partial [Chitinophagaceae bacterium]